MNCTFFGHRNASEAIKEKLEATIIDLIENKNIKIFYVGNNGNFDVMAKNILNRLKTKYLIDYFVVLAYIPTDKALNDISDNTIYPDGLEYIPYKYAIIERNKWMINKSDYVVCYVTNNYTSSAKFKVLAEKKGKTVILI